MGDAARLQLTGAAVADLVAALAGDRSDGNLLRLAGGAAGNPLYVAELACSYLLILEGDHLSAAATASPLLPLLSLMPPSSAASRRRTVGLPGAISGASLLLGTAGGLAGRSRLFHGNNL